MTYDELVEKHATVLDCGLDCGDGWFKILDKMLGELAELNAGVKCVQIKEKFGGLRAYYHSCSDSDKADEIIDRAERAAEQTCERCGKPGKLRDGGWIITLCDECNKSR